MIPFEELAASGIDRATAARLNYRCTPDGGWEIPYLDPQGQPYTYGDGVPFVRRKLKPFQNGGVDHGHFRSRARFGAQKPQEAMPKSVAAWYLGQLTISFSRRNSPKVGSLHGP